MSRYIAFFLPIAFSNLEVIVDDFQKQFDEFLNDNLSENEFKYYEIKIDEIGFVTAQTISNELSLEDFYYKLEDKELISNFFAGCKSFLIIENLPYLETNIFQVTYIKMLLDLFDEVLIDQGGVESLVFKSSFLNKINLLQDMRKIISMVGPALVPRVKSEKPIDAIDFLIRDVYIEIDRLKNHLPNPDELSDKVKKIYTVACAEKLNSNDFFSKVGLNAKEFDDGLERLKFWLRKFSN